MVGVLDRPRQLLVTTEREDGDRVRVSVRDTGVGVDPEVMDKLFDAFYTTKSDGMGIGLSISRSIIEGHGGRLWAESNEGPGADVLVLHSHRLRERHGVAPGEAAMRAERSLVSVVDDDESVRESLPDLLREFGFAAEAFASAEAFLASRPCRHELPDPRRRDARHVRPGAAAGTDAADGKTDPDRLHHRAQRRGRLSAPDRSRSRRLPAQAVQRHGPAGGGEFRASKRA